MPKPALFLSSSVLLPLCLLGTSHAARAQWDLYHDVRAYNDPQGRYSFELPGAWAPAPTASPDAASRAAHPAVAFTGGPITLTVYYQPGADAAGLVRATAALARSSVPGYQEQAAEAPAGAAPAQEFTAAAPDGRPLRGRVVGLTDGTNCLVFVLTAPPDGFETARQLLSLPLVTARLAGAPTVLRAGTPVRLALSNSVSSGSARPGDIVSYSVLQNVYAADGRVAVAAGAVAVGRVLNSHHRSFPLTNGRLAVSIESVRAVDGTLVPLGGRPPGQRADTRRDGPAVAEGRANSSASVLVPATAAVIATTLQDNLTREFAIFSLIGSTGVGDLLNGADAQVPAGMIFQVQVRQDVRVQPK